MWGTHRETPILFSSDFLNQTGRRAGCQVVSPENEISNISNDMSTLKNITNLLSATA